MADIYGVEDVINFIIIVYRGSHKSLRTIEAFQKNWLRALVVLEGEKGISEKRRRIGTKISCHKRAGCPRSGDKAFVSGNSWRRAVLKMLLFCCMGVLPACTSVCHSQGAYRGKWKQFEGRV